MKNFKRFFKDLKRVVSQFFETEYWYRWRKIEKDGERRRAVDTLNDTWNGPWTLLNWSLLKIDHMYCSLRKYGITARRYLDSSTILEYGNNKDLKHCLSIYLDVIKESKYEDYFWYGSDDFYIGFKKDKFVIYKKRLVKTIPASQLKHPEMELKFDGENHMIAEPLDKNVYEFDVIASFDTFEALEKDLSKYDTSIKSIKDFEVGLIRWSQSIHFRPKDYLHLSAKLKDKIRGLIPTLHNIWEFRKLIKKLNAMDFHLSEPWSSMLLDIGNDDSLSQEELSKRYNECWDSFVKTRFELLQKIIKIWNEKSDDWWD